MARKRRRNKKLSKQLVGLGLLAALTAGVVAYTLAPTSTPQTAYVAPLPTVTPSATVKPITFAAYGDSISNGNSPDFAAGKFGTLSWPSYVGPATFAGGWAKGGVQTAEMLAHAKPVTADVLILLAGTNDYGHGIPFAVTSANLDGIVKETGIGRVIVSAVPPNDSMPEAAVAFNEKLGRLASARGWKFVDPMAGVRAGDVYAPGMTRDGIHPTEAAARIIGETIRATLVS